MRKPLSSQFLNCESLIPVWAVFGSTLSSLIGTVPELLSKWSVLVRHGLTFVENWC